MDMLNSKEHIGITLKPEVAAELDQRQSLLLEQTNVQGVHQPLDPSLSVQREPEDKTVAHVDGQSLYDINEGKGWYREGKHGREVTVDDIKVEPVRNEQGEQQKDAKGNNLYLVLMLALAHRSVEPCLLVLPLWVSWVTCTTAALLYLWSIITTMIHDHTSILSLESIHHRTSPHEPLMQESMPVCTVSDLDDRNIR